MTDCYKLYTAMINPGRSAWKQRFEARTIADLVSTLKFFVHHPITGSNPWIKRAVHLRNQNAVEVNRM